MGSYHHFRLYFVSTLFLLILRQGFGGAPSPTKFIFDAGDIVESRQYLKISYHLIHRYYYAISKKELVSFPPSFGHCVYGRMYPKVLRPNYDYTRKELHWSRSMTHDQSVGMMGGFVARMMIGTQLPYGTSGCNDEHYAKYLAYGAYSPEKWNVHKNFKISRKCPVRAPLNMNDVKKVEREKTFTLLDANGREIRLSALAWRGNELWSAPRTWKPRWAKPEVTERYSPLRISHTTDTELDSWNQLDPAKGENDKNDENDEDEELSIDGQFDSFIRKKRVNAA